MSNFTFNTTKSIQYGAGLLNHLGSISLPVTGSKVLLVTDKGLQAAGIVDRAIESLSAQNIDVITYDQVVADPPESVVMAATDLAIDYKVSGVIGLGGGSSMDTAKLAALLAHSREKLSDIYGVNKSTGSRLPLILVPTTSGTGSEVTMISVITTGKTTKMGVVTPALLPDIALLDPMVTLSLPPHITAATGIDAMVHAIEAYSSASPNNNPISRSLALQALPMIASSIESAVHNGTDIDARKKMLLGSMYAGQAFANSPCAAVHALAYPLGGHYKIPHGLSNALILPEVLRFNAGTTPEPYAEIAPHVFANMPSGDALKSALAFADRMAELSAKCGLPQRLRDVGVAEGMLQQMAQEAVEQTRLMVNNPREVTVADALAIYQAAY